MKKEIRICDICDKNIATGICIACKKDVCAEALIPSDKCSHNITLVIGPSDCGGEVDFGKICRPCYDIFMVDNMHFKLIHQKGSAEKE